MNCVGNFLFWRNMTRVVERLCRAGRLLFSSQPRNTTTTSSIKALSELSPITCTLQPSLSLNVCVSVFFSPPFIFRTYYIKAVGYIYNINHITPSYSLYFQENKKKKKKDTLPSFEMSEPDSTPVSEDVSQETPEATTPSDVTIPRTSEQAARQEEALTDVRLDDDEENGNEASGSVEEDIDPTSEQDGLDEAEEEEKLESTEKEDGTATNDDDSSEGSKNGTISSATEQKDLPTIDIPLTDDNENINGNGQGDTAASMESESDPSTPNSHSRRRSKRAPSIALSISSTGSGQQTVSSMVFVKKALETISKSSDARKISPLDNAVKKALSKLCVYLVN